MKKRTVLVSGASGVVGYGILRSLRQSGHDLCLIGTTIYDFSVAPKFCDVFEKALPTDHPEYLNWLCDTIEKHSVDMVIPSIECDMFLWDSVRDRIREAGAFPLLNRSELIQLCCDKWIFYEELVRRHSGCAIPTTLDPEQCEFPFPLLLKPRKGFGSKGIVKVESFEELELHRSRIGGELMIQPVVGTGDEEYTVSAFFSDESHLLSCFPLKRKLSGEGFTQEAIVSDHDFSPLIQELGQTFKPIGPTNFQFRKENGKMRLLEINPRISSATSIRAALGYNEGGMSLDYFLEGITPSEADLKSLQGARAVRYLEDYVERDCHN